MVAFRQAKAVVASLLLHCSFVSEAQWPFVDWPSDMEEMPRSFLHPDARNSETESDELAYTKPVVWEKHWLTARRAHDLSAVDVDDFAIVGSFEGGNVQFRTEF